MPQLFCIFTFIFLFLLLPPAFSTGLIAKRGCQDRCGNISIPYPFGVGSGCSLAPSFDISCDASTTPPRPYLSIMNKEVIEVNKTFIRVKASYVISSCYGSTEKRSSMSVNLSGTPYSLSYWNRLTVIGCDDLVVESNGSWVGGGCSAICAEKNDTGGIGYCPNSASSLGNGCCQARIFGATVFLGAQLVDLSGNLARKKLFPCSYAFIQERLNLNESAFSYPLFYLDNSTALQNDNWRSMKTLVVRLDWTINIGAENCSQAKQNPKTYACQAQKSACVDDFHIYSNMFRGHICSCVSGYEGNPYLPGGCKAISSSSSIAKNGCQDQCGKILIPYPFGVGTNCFLAPSFEIVCNASTNPPIAYLRVLNAEIIQLNSSNILLNYPNKLGLACYNLTENQHNIFKSEERSLIIDLLGTQYTLSDKNWLTTFGCDDMVVGIINGQFNRSFTRSSCVSSCWNSDPNYFGYCPRQSSIYMPGHGCCYAPIPRGTTYLEANLSDLSGQWQHRKVFSCSYVFIKYKDEWVRNSVIYPLYFLDNSSTEIPTKSWSSIALDWRIGAENCKEASRNQATFACKGRSACLDFDTTIGGYLCNCMEGYKGNPYLPPGCQDINECADSTTNPCHPNSTCINTSGGFNCSCSKGYFGDGRKDGMGCIHLPQSKSKMIILIGMGSGLGILLFILMCFWLYKLLQKRKEKILKEKFFKRNGGLLLQQQTNESTLGKTKVFSAKELEIATDNFNESRILGQGGQGTVYKGMLSDGKIVAVKKSKVVEENQLEQFINEVVILSQINHRNVVKLLGCCLETDVPLLVYEFMPNGTLFDLIHDSNNEFPVPWNMRLKISADIAGALAYLHSASSMPIYHRDIKSSNILLDEKYVVKVSDFGTSRSIGADQTHLTTMVKGTFGYLDPEYFQSSQFTDKSDVYSFGVVLVELLTGQRPISLDKTEDDRGLATRFLKAMEENFLDTVLDPQVLEQGRKEEVVLVARLAQRCLNFKGKMRPTMKEVATELESFRISQMSTAAKDESKEVIGVEDMPTTISDTEYTWTCSYKSATASSSDTHPLIFTTE